MGMSIKLYAKCRQCFDAVGWALGRASGLQKFSDEVLAWLSVWSEVQMICKCYSFIKSRTVLPFWSRLTQVVLDKNSSGDEIANVNFYAVRPGSYRIR